MLRPEPEVDLDVMHHAEDVEDDTDRIGWACVIQKKTVSEGKGQTNRCRTSTLVMFGGFGTATPLNTYM